MLDSLTGEIFRPLLRGTKLRLVTVALLFSILFAGIEASTQVVSLFFLNRRIETTSRLLGSTSLTPEQRTTLAAVEAANIDDLARVNATVHSPGKFLWRMASRFAKGVAPILPFVLFFGWLAFKAFFKVPSEQIARTVFLSLAWSLFRLLIGFGVANGLISAYWNTSETFFVSTIAFPVLSAVVLAAILAVLLIIEEREPVQSEKPVVPKQISRAS